MNKSRKRMRSEVFGPEDDYNGVQLKFFVNQKLIDKCDQNAMKRIYEKTLGMMLAGARIKSQIDTIQPSESVDARVDESVAPVIDIIDDELTEPQGCKLCWRDIENSSKIACKNCSLRICSHCNVNCCGCNASLCTNCVKIFGCEANDEPICDECKLNFR